MAFPGKITSEEGPAADHPHKVFITHCPPADNTVISWSIEKFSSSGSVAELFSTWLLPTAGLVRRQFIFSVFRCLFNLQRGQNVSFSHFFSRVKTERRIRNVYFVSAVYIEKKKTQSIPEQEIEFCFAQPEQVLFQLELCRLSWGSLLPICVSACLWFILVLKDNLSLERPREAALAQ